MQATRDVWGRCFYSSELVSEVSNYVNITWAYAAGMHALFGLLIN